MENNIHSIEHCEKTPFQERRERLCKKLAKISLQSFTARDIGDLIHIFGTWKNQRDCREDHLKRLEKRLKKIKKRKK